MPLMSMFELPCPIEMQSSPVPITEEYNVTPLHLSMWIPSVLGLFSGALILIRLPQKLLTPTKAMWKNLLFTDVIDFTTVLVVETNLTDCRGTTSH